MAQIDISIVVPIYNEEKVIEASIDEIVTHLGKTKLRWELILVDDGSRDRTVELIEKLPQSNIKLLRNEKNRGKGRAVKIGALEASGQHILFTDADLSAPFSQFSVFYLERQSDIVIASRRLPDSLVETSFMKSFSGEIASKIIRTCFLPGIYDTQCGFKLFKGEVLKELVLSQYLERWGFDVELLFLARLRRYNIVELPITWTHNYDSKVSAIDYLATFSELLKIYYHYSRGHYRH